MIILFFLIGLAVGSFLNTVIYRLEKGESVVKARSYCPQCRKILSWFELIPLMSFIFQKGRCRHCKKPISLQYSLVELATGILFALCAWYFFPNILYSIFYILVSSFLIIIFVYDLKHYIIPDQVIYPAIIVSGIWCLASDIFMRDTKYEILNSLFAAILAGAFFLAIILGSKGKWMGMGDFKLAIFMGLILGLPKILVSLFLAFLIGAFISIILIILKKKTLKSQIPFGPFLVGATILTLFLGDKLIDLYLNLLV